MHTLYAILAVFALFCCPLCCGHAMDEQRDRKSSRLDNNGDPLPAGAISRLGTIRWRFPGRVNQIQFVEGGKHLLVCNTGGLVQILDSCTGQRIRQLGSTNGSRLTAISKEFAIIAEAA